MNKIISLFLIILVGVLGIFLLLQSQIVSEEDPHTDQLSIITSLLPVQSLVERIGGEHVQVASMVPAGASVHTYEPTPSQLKEVARADIFMKLGTPIEFEVTWLDKLLETNDELVVVDLSRGVNLIDFVSEEEDDDEDHHEEDDDEHGHDHEGGVDPHIWLSPMNLQTMAMTIGDGLAQLDQENASYYQEQKELVLQELQLIDAEIRSVLQGASNRDLIVYHDAWGYFANDYDLSLIAIEENEKEPTAKHLQEVISLGKEHNVQVVFASPEFNTQSAETIAKEIGAEVILISPLPADIFAAFEEISNAFALGLQS